MRDTASAPGDIGQRIEVKLQAAYVKLLPHVQPLLFAVGPGAFDPLLSIHECRCGFVKPKVHARSSTRAVMAALTGLQVYRRLQGYTFKSWRLLILAVVGMIIDAATDTAFAALMKPMLDGSFVARDPSTIRWVPIALIGILLARGLGSFLASYFMALIGRQVVKQLRGEMFAYLLRAPVTFFDHASSGQLISKLTYNAEQVVSASSRSLTVLIRDSLTVVGLLAWMFYLNWVLALSFLLTAPVIAAGVVLISQRFRQVSRRIQHSMGDITHVAEEVVEGHRVVKIFGGEAREAERFERVNEHNRRMQMKMTLTEAVSAPVVQFVVGLALAGIVWLATLGPVLETITVGTFVSFMIAMMLLLPPARNLTNINARVQQGIAAGDSIFQLLDNDPEPDAGRFAPEVTQGRIRFAQVRFSYDSRKGEVLKGISLAIEPGETVALVGRSGSGKTTLVNLLPRFYPLDQGAIFIDEVDIRDWRLAHLREQITYVGQQVVLFNDTIAYNIAYGRLGQTPRVALETAARRAQAWEFIERLPQGLDTRIGENGVLLSGGQRQRLAIARALLKDAPVLILDEATSALDTEAERQIQAALETLKQGRTTLIIAHRLSTIENADRILVLERGEIVEAGRHETLLAQNGLYAHLYRLQARESPKPVVAAFNR